jgi:3-oxoacyl-(acyl-carrier-protein) synthase
VASACATGGDSIGLSMQIIRAGRADVMVAGGADAMINPLMMSILTRMQAQSRRSEATPSPFSATRDGLVSGEGAGVLVLESLEHAKKRGATILAELAGYGATTDAFHLTAPREDASETARAMTMAMEDAGLNPEDVDYVNTHGTGTVLNDPAETLAIKLALGQHAYEIPASATKSMTGHIMGATAAMEAIFSILSIRNGVVPPTINYTEPDPACDLDYVPNAPREMPVRVVLSNSFGFGGHNAVLALRAFEG